MPKQKKITLAEAQDLYAKNEAIRDFLESKFSKEELTAAQPQAEESIAEKFKRVWETEILTKYGSTRFLDRNFKQSAFPTSCVELRNSEGDWMLTYSYEEKSFWYSLQRVQTPLKFKVTSDETVLCDLVKDWVEDTLGLKANTFIINDRYADGPVV